MKERIHRFIMDSFKDELYNKAMSCLHALRKESIKVQSIILYLSNSVLGPSLHGINLSVLNKTSITWTTCDNAC